MHRSLLYSIRRYVNNVTFVKAVESGRFCLQLVPSTSSIDIKKSVHCSTSLRYDVEGKGEKNDKKVKSSKQKKSSRLMKEEEELQSAAVEAAKSLPGDWTRTADELMARLSMKVDSSSGTFENEPPSVQNSLLSTMKVGRSFEKSSGNRNRFGQEGRDSGQEKHRLRKRLARKSEVFTSIYSQPRLGVFDAAKLNCEATKSDQKADDEVNLWQVVAREKIDLAKGGLPTNGFEEMIQWTKHGRMWTFPINNEEDMHEERQYKFHEHVFLNQYLKKFPSDGPLRRFMDLVALGLSKNPWISVPEKVEHLKWYTNYFREKQQLLESSIGEKAKMNQS